MESGQRSNDGQPLPPLQHVQGSIVFLHLDLWTGSVAPIWTSFVRVMWLLLLPLCRGQGSIKLSFQCSFCGVEEIPKPKPWLLSLLGTAYTSGFDSQSSAPVATKLWKECDCASRVKYWNRSDCSWTSKVTLGDSFCHFAYTPPDHRSSREKKRKGMDEQGPEGPEEEGQGRWGDVHVHGGS
ncbi:unnamed protein product [Triticum turgidum subsp. durum]|uniref:Uncharacterized protein n=1 Tax=Triticum turgidum subsp. durum TaxID=4567 RepID=A0A9R0Y9I1_TRITD|nr:unnamed protein product [Triticum turgidum subsp. durum]